ncbi:hypothetical protein BamIOP4010DRAFT_6915 [Burkholderia ambifaria IOP40-10]|uniref:Uncharacterized protein n=1 Tax=Burkholderia ambifaria IOP40-10 TaxID=396596 RepID=B1FSA2_9BURK|nr:hypothetical protein BamIOP4010DRAFT_6915 [Burkholderia ambifaria IOP40-10]
MSTWNFSAENAHVPTPMNIVTAVNSAAVPRWRIASANASGNVAPWRRSCCRRSYR